MTDSRAAVGYDRLPWLDDEPERAGRKWRLDLAGWAVAGALLVAGGSYWLGTKTAEDAAPAMERIAPRSTTMPLPVPQVAQPQVEPDRVPEVEPVPAPTVSMPGSRAERSRPRQRTSVTVHKGSVPSIEAEKTAGQATNLSPSTAIKAPVVAKPEKLTLWPSRQVKGASGRLVQIGAFGTRQQAKLGWRYMSRSYPAVKRLPAVVVDARNSRGRHFYRFQIGTTSQAHSEVLCQRMEKIHLSCAVIGLPGAKKAVER
jgi:hypothetical protein